jgi:mono/diheme cytochrome c family protein
MRKSVQLRAGRLQVPPLGSEQQLARGAACYLQKCAQCHGGPGFAQAEIGRSMQPLPGPLVDASGKWTPAELYWITRNGIKMSGMPAWQHHLREDELWAVVAFVQQLPALTPTAYRELMGELVGQTGRCRASEPSAAPATAFDRAQRGQLALRMYGCHACHSIPGVSGPHPQVGPPLAGFASRQLIAGRLANTHDNLVMWIRHPQRVDPRTAMPDQAVTQEHADEIAAYLATLR